LTGDGDSFEARVDAEGAKNVADVVTDSFGTQVELLRDLLRRAPMLKQAEHFPLTGC
jgi:hypothetical protein